PWRASAPARSRWLADPRGRCRSWRSGDGKGRYGWTRERAESCRAVLYPGVVVRRVDVGQNRGRIAVGLDVARAEDGHVEHAPEILSLAPAIGDEPCDLHAGGVPVARHKGFDAAVESNPRAIV